MVIKAAIVLFVLLCGPSCVAAPVNKAHPTVTPMTVGGSPAKEQGIALSSKSVTREGIVAVRSAADSRRQSEKERADDLDEQTDATAFSDLPKLEINEDALKGQQLVGDDQLIERELRRLLSEFGEENAEVPEIFLNEVKLYIRAYRQNPVYRKFIAASLKRSARYMASVKRIFTGRNIPEDMAYIAFVESGFNPNARSRAGALGMWQFMPGTARDYSLKVGNGVDERLDPARSTYAACEYFHDLIAIFGPRSFLIALAAYNAGEGKVMSCLKRIDNPLQERTFWHIRPCLAPESREYPPKIIAAAIIGNNPDVFGFSRHTPMGGEMDVEKASDTVELLIRNRTSRRTAQATETTVNTGRERKMVRVVKTAGQRKGEGSSRTRPELLTYTVRKGNTLDGVAEAFGVGRNEIVRWNQLKGNQLRAGARLKIYLSRRLSSIRYTVRNGDTVREIGQSFGVRPVRIIVCNGLHDGVAIKRGQSLLIYRETKGKPIVYKVKKGSNLTRIAETFDVRARDIMRWNNLSSPSVFPNQRLLIYRDSKDA